MERGEVVKRGREGGIIATLSSSLKRAGRERSRLSPERRFGVRGGSGLKRRDGDLISSEGRKKLVGEGWLTRWKDDEDRRRGVGGGLNEHRVAVERPS